jgi:hypothetical protein
MARQVKPSLAAPRILLAQNFSEHSTAMTHLEHWIYSWSGREPLDTVEMHVLARAYRDAWRSLHACDPVNQHVIESLDVVIDFDNRPHPGPAANQSQD